jgi:hypothetical protein
VNKLTVNIVVVLGKGMTTWTRESETVLAQGGQTLLNLHGTSRKIGTEEGNTYQILKSKSKFIIMLN